MKKLTVILFFTISFFASAQQIYISKGYTSSGEPIDLIYNQKTEPEQSLCVILNNNKIPLSQNLIFFYVDIVGKTGRNNQISKMIRPEKNSTWLLEKFKFAKEGYYEVYFTDFNRKKIASYFLFVVKKEKKKLEVQPEVKPELRIIFSRRIQNSKPFNVIEKASLNRDDGEIYIYILNDRPLNFEKLMISIWRKSKSINEFDEFIDSRKFEINPSWNDTFLKYKFTKTGQYKINLFDEKELLIKTAYISVEN